MGFIFFHIFKVAFNPIILLFKKNPKYGRLV
jgi:hypothetical protein